MAAVSWWVWIILAVYVAGVVPAYVYLWRGLFGTNLEDADPAFVGYSAFICAIIALMWPLLLVVWGTVVPLLWLVGRLIQGRQNRPV